ncbi:MAG: 23S rRNA pseudouridine(955/2504/2580) synthase [Beggiatoa sp. IS2]|nr:MAG: 23S rRNA pseudouridine(955/2504/2580) synthase [Beggiatoa sp. IS2]
MSLTTLKSQQVTYLTIVADYAGQRIDNFLLTHCKGVPKSHIYRILRTGEVRINQGRVKPTYRLQMGDTLRLPPIQYLQSESPQTPNAHILQRLTQSVVYEDASLLVINKPAGLAVHGGSGIDFGVIEGLRALYPNAKNMELVHRLDRETSGCLMIAKKRSLLRQLHELLREGKIRKHYLALVKGAWPARLTQVELPLHKNVLQSGERFVRVNIEGKPSQSQFKVIQHFATATLLQVRPLTGRTHQIRVHTAHQGHPIAGDEKYGDETFNRYLRDFALKRLFLHATQLEIGLDSPITVNAPLPTDLQQVLQRLTTSAETTHA